MKNRRSEDTLYPVILVASLFGLVALGLLGIPALLVAAIGAVAAAIAIGVFHRALEGRAGGARPVRRGRGQLPRHYVPSVLEGSSLKRHRLPHLRRHRHPTPPLRLR
jgi:hypothetical protein